MSSPFQDYPGFAVDEPEAERRFNIAKNIDPFPGIQPSLLNSADISDYVRMTGMLYPFSPDQAKLKSASYEAAIAGRCIWWDAKGEQFEVELEKDGDEFLLEANSIAFVQVQPSFRLPDYIALRFNLKIMHVHRGILLGTGPLVDPGFVGKLLIPLHNLTTNPYRFRFGEGLIWVEFTKTSIYPGWPKDGSPHLTRKGTFHAFPPEKYNLEPEDYLRKASPHRPIRSSIPEVGRESKDAAHEAANKARSASRLVRDVSIYGGIILLLTLGTLTFQTWSLIREANKAVSDVHQVIQDNRKDQLGDLQGQIQAIEKRTLDEMVGLRRTLEKINSEVTQVQSRLAVLKRQREQPAK